jgi:hypothetical protein
MTQMPEQFAAGVLLVNESNAGVCAVLAETKSQVEHSAFLSLLLLSTVLCERVRVLFTGVPGAQYTAKCEE